MEYMNRVLVLLSTYNGVKYLCEQLDSLLAQTDVDLTVLVRDDGSLDGTTELLKKYHDHYPDKIIIDFADNIGCNGSFFALMKLAAKKYDDYDFYAFSDQDDVWLPDKMYAAAKALNKIDNNISLYYCSPQLVDQHLTPINANPIIAKATLEESFILQPCIGCSMVFSKDLLKKASVIDPMKVNIHDAWVYKLCLSLGGEIVFDTTPHILYRQHSSNAIGRTQGFKKKWARRLNFFVNSNRIRSSIAQLILNTYQTEIPQRQKEVLSSIANYYRSFRSKLKIIFNGNYSTNYRLHNLMFKIAILFGKI